MLSFRIFLWLVITFVPITVRNRGRERWWWYANCPEISDRRKIEFFLTLILLPCWVRYLMKFWIMVRNGGVSPSRCRNGCGKGSLQAPQGGELGTPLFKRQIHPCNGVSSVWWLHLVASWTACCALLRPNGMHRFRPSYLFQCPLKISLPWSFLLEWFVWGFFLQPKSYQSLL